MIRPEGGAWGAAGTVWRTVAGCLGLVGARLCGPSVLISLALGGEGGGCPYWMEDSLQWFAQAIDSGRRIFEHEFVGRIEPGVAEAGRPD